VENEEQGQGKDGYCVEAAGVRRVLLDTENAEREYGNVPKMRSSN